MSTADMAQHLATYFQLMSINGGAQVYRHAVTSGVLDALKGGLADVTTVAARCDAQAEPTALLLGVLGSLGLVTEKEGQYQLTAVAAALIDSPYRNLGDEYWAYLPSFLNTGVPLKAMDDTAQSEAHYVQQAKALAWMLQPAAMAAAAHLQVGARRKGMHVLDVGAGAAVWSLAMAAVDPAACVTAVDWPAVLQIARAAAAQYQLGDRFETIEGNFHEVELPVGAFDLAIVANVTHLQPAAGNEALFTRLRDSLSDNGELVIFDVMPGDERGDLYRTLYELGLALRTENGRLHPPADLCTQLHNAGFDPADPHILPAPPNVMGAIVATKRPQ